MGSNLRVQRVGTLPAVLPGGVCGEGDAPNDKCIVEEGMYPRQVLQVAWVQLFYGMFPGDCGPASLVVEGAGLDV